mmetsp:Transcript_15007/g.32551  ORF Transcript_15007/g.32551 Transcript_15007/m.32551 type:complete len:515 (+) Transcript_15007:60-1604(+)
MTPTPSSSMTMLYALLLPFIISMTKCVAFNPSYRIAIQPKLSLSTRYVAAPTDKQHPLDPLEIRLHASASSGIHCKLELPRILDTIASVCEEYGVTLDINNIQCNESPHRLESIPGVLGRVILIRVHGMPSDFDVDDHDFMKQLKIDLSERIDAVLHRDEAPNNQPILLAFQKDGDGTTISDVIEKEVFDYSLKDAVDDVCLVEGEGCFIHPYQFQIYSFPSSHIEIDGAMVEHVKESHFDTSSIIVFDKICPKSLREKLLNVVKGYPENSADEGDEWDDIENGPDPKRWVRGGLSDIFVDETRDDDNGEEGPCWGLTDEAVMDICFNDHPAIAEMESKFAQLFPDFIVARLPEAVLGGCVSTLTANAPTHGDTFDYHIDADPLQVPPSPWADVFGRYPNRSKGKPRFVSCLLYLNDEWEAERWGAPTQFLDPPTQQTCEVFPKPGRCVIMDQDITHTVVAPKAEAGKRPRYSLVWKLILHPKVEGQDMDLSCGRKNLWPEPVIIGSANEIDQS